VFHRIPGGIATYKGGRAANRSNRGGFSVGPQSEIPTDLIRPVIPF